MPRENPPSQSTDPIDPREIFEVLSVRLDWLDYLPEAGEQIRAFAAEEVAVVTRIRQQVKDAILQLKELRERANRVVEPHFNPGEIRDAILASVEARHGERE